MNAIAAAHYPRVQLINLRDTTINNVKDIYNTTTNNHTVNDTQIDILNDTTNIYHGADIRGNKYIHAGQFNSGIQEFTVLLI